MNSKKKMEVSECLKQIEYQLIVFVRFVYEQHILTDTRHMWWKSYKYLLFYVLSREEHDEYGAFQQNKSRLSARQIELEDYCGQI